MYKIFKGKIALEKRLSISEARKRLSRLVVAVSRGGPMVTITQHGKERAALVGIREYQDLSRRARMPRGDKRFKLKGSLELACSPAELIKEMDRIRNVWRDSIRRSSTELAREIGRK